MIRKKLSKDITASASTFPVGVALRVKGPGDKYDNSVAAIELVDGKPVLTLFDGAIGHYGIEVRHDDIQVNEW